MLMPNLKNTAADILDAVQSSPHVKAVLGEINKDRAAARYRATDRLVELDAESGRELQRLLTIHADLYARHLAELERIKAIGVQMNAVAAQRSELAWRIERERTSLEHLLTETASPAIDEFVVWVDDEIAAACRYSDIERPVVVRHVFTGQKQPLPSAFPVVTPANRVATLRLARAEALGLKLLADQVSVPEKLAELKNGLPIIGDKNESRP